nr:pleiotropic drug resistance protein 1-like [Ipomoea batatas]GME17660.1 pleiotropic drug resistance protein 1-like [Ipomoea batatas]
MVSVDNMQRREMLSGEVYLPGHCHQELGVSRRLIQTGKEEWFFLLNPFEMKAQCLTEDKLVLLKGINGAFRPGVLTALMGISGAGKTTLMDVLAGRKIGGYIEGNITISGYPKKQETFARIAGYCEQTDIHSPHVTVYESLVYSAWLRLPPEIDTTTQEVEFSSFLLLLWFRKYWLLKIN